MLNRKHIELLLLTVRPQYDNRTLYKGKPKSVQTALDHSEEYIEVAINYNRTPIEWVKFYQLILILGHNNVKS